MITPIPITYIQQFLTFAMLASRIYVYMCFCFCQILKFSHHSISSLNTSSRMFQTQNIPAK